VAEMKINSIKPLVAWYEGLMKWFLYLI